MYRKLFLNDFRKNPWNNLILLLFMSLSVTLAVSVFLVSAQLVTSISNMYEKANPPHFLQMHKGELVQEEIDSFNKHYLEMKHWQTVQMIDIYGDELAVSQMDGSQFSLTECRLDISLVKQNTEYDVLLDENREPLQLQKGQIGVPVILLEQYPIQIGDVISFHSGDVNKEFTVADFVYDGQMNSTLCSSTRFLISDEDFDELIGNVGETEYLIEAYFTDSSMAADYQTAYEQENLPKNGQAITYTMIFLLSAMTDIMMAMVFLLVGIVLIIIALLVLRYTILTTIEEDKKEIGTMKAIGFSYQGIKKLYLDKIRLLMFLGCIIGYVAALLMSNLLFGHMSRTFGKQPLSFGIIAMGIVVCVVVYGIILFFAGNILRRIRKATVVDTLVTEKGFGKEQNGYRLILIFMVLVSFITIVPNLIVNTMQNKDFMTYMGSSAHDILLEVEQGEGLEERKQAAQALLEKERENGVITDYECFRKVRLQAMDIEGELQGIHIDTGKSAGAGLQYVSGKNPVKNTDIALSCLIADSLGKKTGDELLVMENGGVCKFFISGIYQDVTSGGRTAKAICGFPGMEAEKYDFQIDVNAAYFGESEIEELRNALGKGYSIEYMEEFIRQTLGGIISQIQTATVIAFGIGIGLIILIAALFLKLRIVSEVNFFAVKKAIGISYQSICLQELWPILRAGVAGCITGILLSAWLGDDMVSLMFSMLGLGIEKIKFIALPFEICAMIPVVLLAVLVVVTLIACRQIKRIDIASYINE